MARPHPSDEPVGGAALAASARAAADALGTLARAAGAPGIAAQASAVRARVDVAAGLNAETYAKALAVREESAGLSPGRRDWSIGRAYAEAAEPPLELARAAADLAELAAELDGPDAAALAALAAGVARGASVLVAANLTAIPGDERVSEAGRLAESAARLVRDVD